MTANIQERLWQWTQRRSKHQRETIAVTQKRDKHMKKAYGHYTCKLVEYV